MSSILKTIQAYMTPFLFILWVVCGVVLICQYKGMLPWLEGWPQQAIWLITFIPPVLLVLYAIIELIRKYVIKA